MAVARLDWHGEQIMAKLRTAAALAVDKTLAEAVKDAREDHPGYPPASDPYERYANRTGFLTASITLMEAADPTGLKISGKWGSTADYALYVEVGTSRTGPRAQTRVMAADGRMWSITPPTPVGDPRMAPRYTLRPAADHAYSLLGARFGAAYRGETLP